MSRADGRKQAALVLLCAAVFLDSMDLSLMGVALPAIGRDLSLPESVLQWLMSGYAVAYGGFLLLGGRVADLFGRRRVFLLSLAVFAAASLAGGLLSAGWPLVVNQVVKGVAAALTAAAALSLITTTFTEGAQRNRALGVYSLAGATGYTAGLIASGLLTEISWRLVFFLPVPVAVLVLVVAPLLLPRGLRPPGTREGFDAAGAVAVTGGVLLLVFSLTERNRPAGVVAVLLLVAFVAIERRRPAPLVPLEVFRSGTVAAAGMLVQGAGILLFLRAGATGDYLTVLLPALVVHGVGNGLSFPSLNIAAVGGLPDERQGLASGLVTSSVQIGAGIGVAALAAVMTLGESARAGYRIAFLTAGGFSLVGALIAAYGLRSRHPAPVPTT